MKFVLLILGPPIVAIIVGYVTRSWIWGIVSFPIAMFVFNRIAVWLFGHPSKEEVRRMAERPVKDDFSKEELQKEVAQIESKSETLKEMRIERESKGLIPSDDGQVAPLEGLNVGFRSPVRHFRGRLDSIARPMVQPGSMPQPTLEVPYNFSDLEVFESTEPYPFPILQISIMHSDKKQSAMGVLSASIDKMLNAGLNANAPQEQGKNQDALVGVVQEWKVTGGHMMWDGNKGKEVPRECWEVVWAEGFGGTTHSGVSSPASNPGRNISQINYIEEYDVELRKDIIRLEEMYEKDRDFDRKEAEVFFERRLSKEEADELIDEKAIGPLGHGVSVEKRLQWEKQALEYIKDFPFRVAILHLIGRFGMPVKVYTKEKVFNFDESALTKEEQEEFVRHCEKSIIGSHDATLSNRSSYPSLELMKFMATVLEKYGAEKLQEAE